MNKALKVVLNILIVAAAIGLFVSVVVLGESFKYKNREVEDPAETYAGIFDYMLENRAYGEIMEDYYSNRNKQMTPEADYENLYQVGEYGHAAFMARVYDEKGDGKKAEQCRQKTAQLREQLGAYEYTAGEIDAMIQKAP